MKLQHGFVWTARYCNGTPFVLDFKPTKKELDQLISIALTGDLKTRRRDKTYKPFWSVKRTKLFTR